ncbi:hypothetical protein INS90_04435 [Trueperella pecoris]|uniref:Uncharacterized protein n=1 Tax=Trueperella pecoris TaxID=2733571 RepID=A0A7M1R4X5_9ACTO|nr:hypothetical protein [Trueperella pecoris]QOR48515.1 hypothetical protein INS90_04435 [Trueperella pecoris]
MREEDRERDWDAEWIRLESTMKESDHPREDSYQQAAGFRTWTPAPEEDEPFDPADLPEAQPPSPASQPQLARVFFVLTGAVGLLYVLGFFELLSFSRDWWLVVGTLGLLSAAAGVYFSAPWAHGPDDDGTRV